MDCNKIYSYKYNENIFKKITNLADGKNHGLIFILDWSFSMTETIYDTIKQLFSLLMFCKKTSIPFEVYAFTTAYPCTSPEESYKKMEKLLHVGNNFSLMNIFTHKVSNKILNEQMKNIFYLCYNFKHSVSVPIGMNLKSTLNETFIALNQIIPKFKK